MRATLPGGGGSVFDRRDARAAAAAASPLSSPHEPRLPSTAATRVTAERTRIDSGTARRACIKSAGSAREGDPKRRHVGPLLCEEFRAEAAGIERFARGGPPARDQRWRAWTGRGAAHSALEYGPGDQDAPQKIPKIYGIDAAWILKETFNNVRREEKRERVRRGVAASPAYFGPRCTPRSPESVWFRRGVRAAVRATADSRAIARAAGALWG